MYTSSALLALVVATAPASDSVTSGPVTLEQALALALTENAELKVTRSQLSVAEAAIPMAHDWAMPKLGVQANRFDAAEGSFAGRISLSWSPPNPWEWRNGGDAAKARVLEAQSALADQRWKVMGSLRLAWLDVSGAAVHEALARQTIAVRARLLAVLRHRLEQGQSTQVEVNLAKLAQTDALQDSLRWQSAGLRASQAVAGLVGVPVVPLPASLPEEPPQTPPFAQLEARLERHPALESLRARVQTASATEKSLAARRLPWPELQVQYRQRFGSAEPNEDVQLGLSVPLDVTPAPQLGLARTQTARAQAQLEAERAQRRAQLRILTARAEGLRERWLSFQQDFQETLASHRALQERVLSEGSLDPTVLMTADRQAIDLEHKRLEVRLDLARALVELEITAGPTP